MKMRKIRRIASLICLLSVFTLILGVSPVGATTNLVSNGDFEQFGFGRPMPWSPYEVYPARTSFGWGQNDGVNGSIGISLGSTDYIDSWWGQTVSVTPGHTYRLSAQVKGQNIVSNGSVGANVSITGPSGSGCTSGTGGIGTFDWTNMSVTFTAPSNGSVDIGLRLGYTGSTASGMVWFDNVVLEEI